MADNATLYVVSVPDAFWCVKAGCVGGPGQPEHVSSVVEHAFTS